MKLKCTENFKYLLSLPKLRIRPQAVWILESLLKPMQINLLSETNMAV